MQPTAHSRSLGRLLALATLVLLQASGAAATLQVLVVDEEPRWELRYLMRELCVDPAVQATICLGSVDPGTDVADTAGGLCSFRELPVTIEALAGFDVVILGEVSPRALPEVFLGLLAGWVRDLGGGLIVAWEGGADLAAVAASPLAPLLPVQLVTDTGDAEVTADADGEPVVTAAGREDPWLQALLPDRQAPPGGVLAWQRCAGLRSGATSLLEVSPSGPPLLARGSAGKGQVLYVGLPLWRWRGSGAVTPQAWIWSVQAAHGEGGGASEGTGFALPGQVEVAIRRGHELLLGSQREDGAWEGTIGFKLNTSYQTQDRGPHVGVTALACLSLMAGRARGDPGGKVDEAVRRGLAYLLATQSPDGYVSAGGSRMKSHALATLCLAEALGEVGDPGRVSTAVERAVGLLASCQNEAGGWRYQPGSEDGDVAVTGLVLVALQEARECGVAIPDAVLTRGRAFLEACRVDRDGTPWHWTFRYTPEATSRITFAITAAGLDGLSGADLPAPPGASSFYPIAYLRSQERPRGESGAPLPIGYLYGHFHVSHLQAGAAEGEPAPYRQELTEELLEWQQADGGWIDVVGETYATAMATLILQQAWGLYPP